VDFPVMVEQLQVSWVVVGQVVEVFAGELLEVKHLHQGIVELPMVLLLVVVELLHGLLVHHFLELFLEPVVEQLVVELLVVELGHLGPVGTRVDVALLMSNWVKGIWIDLLAGDDLCCSSLMLVIPDVVH
jgi:hypothetical protein